MSEESLEFEAEEDAVVDENAGDEEHKEEVGLYYYILYVYE